MTYVVGGWRRVPGGGPGSRVGTLHRADCNRANARCTDLAYLVREYGPITAQAKVVTVWTLCEVCAPDRAAVRDYIKGVKP